MYRCVYCKRHLKKKYDKCPGCGGHDFKHLQNVGELIIKEPPKDGYIVNLVNFKHKRKEHRAPFLIGLYMLGAVILFGIIFISLTAGTAKETGSDIFTYIFVAFGIIFIFAGIYSSKDIFSISKGIRNKENSNIKRIKYLSKNGMLIKNLKYKVKPVDKRINNQKTVYKIQVIYEIEKGKTMCFESEPKFLSALGRDDGTVDLLIDPKDYSNYFIDFEIY